jgi:hypothetical protein
VPGSHGSHAAVPRVGFFLPGAQAVHASAPAPVYPALQLQFEGLPGPGEGFSSKALVTHCVAAPRSEAASATTNSAARQPPGAGIQAFKACLRLTTPRTVCNLETARSQAGKNKASDA